MPLTLPDLLPAIELLKQENIFVMDSTRANTQDIRPLRIAILNLMPIKITTETDFIRLLSNTPLQIQIEFMKIKSHTSKNTPVEHMMMFYRDFEEMKKEKYDGLIVTGAPLEQMDYEEVTYWGELQEVSTGRTAMSLRPCTSVGQHRLRCTTSTGCLSTRRAKRCLAYSSTRRWCRTCLYSADLTTSFSLLTAAIAKYCARTSRRLTH